MPNLNAQFGGLCCLTVEQIAAEARQHTIVSLGEDRQYRDAAELALSHLNFILAELNREGLGR